MLSGIFLFPENPEKKSGSLDKGPDENIYRNPLIVRMNSAEAV